MTADDPRAAALVASQPTVSERSYTLWQVYSPSSGGIALSSESRDDAEKWLRRIARPDNDYCLRSQDVRTRTEQWWAEPVIVPWTWPCSWVRGVDEPPEANRCSNHDWHGPDEPVPARFWRPITKGASNV